MKRWTIADTAFLLAGIIYAAFLYLRVHYAGLYMGRFGPLTWDWLIMGYYMSEAALVGSFADWFAVTAVFKVPWLGRLLPFIGRHTAILLKSKASFIHGCGKMVQQEFLTKKTLLLQKNQLFLLDEALAYLERPGNREKLEGFLVNFLEGVLRKIDTAELSRKLEKQLKAAISAADAYTRLQALLKNLLAQRKDEEFYDWLCGELLAVAKDKSTRERIRRELKKQLDGQKTGFFSRIKMWFAEKLDIVNVDEATDAICTALIAGATRMQSEERWRNWFIAQSRLLIENMYASGEWQRLLTALQNRAVSDISLAEALKQLLDNMIKALCRAQGALHAAGELAEPTVLARTVSEAVAVLEQDLRADTDFKAKLEAYLQHFLGLAVLRIQSMLGTIVERIMEAMAEKRLVDLVRSKVDKDMQRIRLNGTCMGALLGLLFYLVKCAW